MILHVESQINFPAILSVGLMIWLTLQPLLFVGISLRSLSLKCCKNTPVCAECGASAARVRDELYQSARQMERSRTQQEWQRGDQRWLSGNVFSNKCDVNKSNRRKTERWRCGERERGKVKEIRERERGRGKEKVVAQLRLTLMRSLCDGTWQRRRKQNPPTPMLHNTPPLNWESQSPQRGCVCVCKKECVSVLGGVSECKTK